VRRVVRDTLQKLALVSTAFGLFLIAVSWLMTYPILPGTSDPSSVFITISPFYWIGLAISVPSLLAFRGSSRVQIASAAVLTFLLYFAFSFFFYSPPGPDIWFQSLVSYYVSDGHIASAFQAAYPWPTFFLLGNLFQLVTGLPARILAHFFILVMGVMIPLAVFLIVGRRGTNAVAASFAFSVLGFYFLDFQFAAQTLALSLLMVLLATDFCIRASRPRTLVQIVIFISLCFGHAFLSAFYLLYLGWVFLFGRKRGQGAIERVTGTAVAFVGMIAIYIAVFAYYTGYLGTAVVTLVQSFEQLLGAGLYTRMLVQTAATQNDLVVQFFSRLTVLGTGLIALLMLIRMILKRDLPSRDVAIGAAGLAYLLAGYPLLILGQRGLQVLAITGSLSVGYFAGKGKWRVILLIGLSVTSVSLPMHYAYTLYSPFWRDTASAETVDLVASHYGVPVTAPVFVDASSWDILTFPVMHNHSFNYSQVRDSLYMDTEPPWGPAVHPPYAYVQVTVALERDIQFGITGENTPPISELQRSTGYNRVVDYGSGVWLMYVGT
jgi:hypothetical protein